ncbi:MAG TPA: tRNA 4-thiouridine(8) synthase ThiI [Clostridiales bacterium]|jgi:thiamine biosynthesis protein ThiI|nr:tRNA 4-thiouridine(8) synthase ThiI [Clostridiales bacterium]
MTQTAKTFLIRYGEVALKGQNKPYFEKMLMDRIRKLLKDDFPGAALTREDGLLVARLESEIDSEKFIARVSRAFGVESVSPAIETAVDMDEIGRAAVAYMREQIQKRSIKSFKVEVKRSNKAFPLQSPEIARQIGARLLIELKVLRVDVHDPECRLFIHVRRDRAFIYDEKIKGFGGLPIGTNGKGLVLLSGGIDSPVAAFQMAKRGMRIEALHFHSYPYTSRQAYEKVRELAEQLTLFCGPIRLHSINLLSIQEAIVQNCPEDETIILIRRFMMKLAERIAQAKKCQTLITGENLGQVASQTIEALTVTDQAVSMLVLRPLIGLDKSDIIDIANRIGTFETSILPHEDCCTVFLPKHPKTKPRLEDILRSESRIPAEELIEAAFLTCETELIG